MRPLWFEYPEDEDTYLIEDEYLVGRDLLVAPVIREGEDRRRVYLPSGDRWVSWWTGEVLEGGTEVEVESPINVLPLFAREGAALPTQPVVQHTGEMAHAPLGITVMPGDSSTVSSFYEDAGDGFDYCRGVYSITETTQRAGSLSFKRSGTLSSPRRIGYVEFVGLNAAPPVVTINGKLTTDVSINEETKRLPSRSSRSC